MVSTLWDGLGTGKKASVGCYGRLEVLNFSDISWGKEGEKGFQAHSRRSLGGKFGKCGLFTSNYCMVFARSRKNQIWNANCFAFPMPAGLLGGWIAYISGVSHSKNYFEKLNFPSGKTPQFQRQFSGVHREYMASESRKLSMILSGFLDDMSNVYISRPSYATITIRRIFLPSFPRAR